MNGSSDGDQHKGWVTVRQVFDMLMESQYWPPEDMLEYQRSQLEQLLRHAKAHVPFYKSRLDCVFRHDGSIDWDRWTDIPVVTREDLRDRREDMQATTLPPGHNVVGFNTTSGSSGIPLKVTITNVFSVVAKAAWLRAYNNWGIGPDLTWAKTTHRMPDGRLIEDETEIAETYPDGRPCYVFINRSVPEQRKLELIKNLGVRVLVDSSNSAAILAASNMATEAGLKLDSFIGYGMGVTEEQRRLVRDSLGAVSYSPYSSEECGLIAYECRWCGGFHTCPETSMVETPKAENPDGDGPAWRKGIVTPLFNSGQPLIRYDQGDSVLLSNAACRITSPALAAVEGRLNLLFKFPGRDVPVISVDGTLLKTALQCSAFQIAQTGPLEIEIRFVSSTEAANSAQEKVTAFFRKTLDERLQARFRRMDAIPANAGGKQHRFVREYGP